MPTDIQRRQTAQKPRAPAARWNDAEIKSLLTGLIDAKDNGLMSKNGFFKFSVWASISANFGDPLKKANNRPSESKWSRLKNDYRAVKFLRDLSYFEWDAPNYLVTAESEVWEELAKVHMISSRSLLFFTWKLNNYKQKHPDKLKWRTTPFPWFNDVHDILDESFAAEGSAFVEDSHTAIDNGDESPDDLELRREPPSIVYSTSSLTSSIEDTDSRLRGTTPQARESVPPPAKKRKVSGLSIMEKMGEGIAAMASAMKQTPEVRSKDTVDSTLQGQAQLKVQTEACLTEDGQLLMLDRFTDLALARVYLSIQRDNLRVKFLKKQVERYGNSSYFIDLS
jgi:Myb/SANT-like DNA-binding protein